MKRYAISDIHGNHQTFLRALDDIQLSPSDQLYLLGDYVDRGPDSRGVINTIFELENKGYQLQYITGNHEQYMLTALREHDEEYLQHWLNSGGYATMDSYRISGEDYHQDLHQHLQWMTSLPFYIELEDYLLVHAGINFFSRSSNGRIEEKFMPACT
ncbi:MAG: metallophosphoesterase family protein, partial [Bacteroidota bacterium]